MPKYPSQIRRSESSFSELHSEYKLPIRLLGIGLPLTIIIGTILAVLLFRGELNIWEAAALATILAPTDAALGQAVVSSPRVPICTRQALNVESGLNDGICLPILLIFLSLAETIEHAGSASFWLSCTLNRRSSIIANLNKRFC